jgi:hypothetical protein
LGLADFLVQTKRLLIRRWEEITAEKAFDYPSLAQRLAATLFAQIIYLALDRTA